MDAIFGVHIAQATQYMSFDPLCGKVSCKRTAHTAQSFLQLAGIGERKRFSYSDDQHTRQFFLYRLVLVYRYPILRVGESTDDFDPRLGRFLDDEDEGEDNTGDKPSLRASELSRFRVRRN